MRRRVNPWVVILTAALTFGSLMAFVGPHRFGPYGSYGFGRRWQGYGGYQGCDGYGHNRAQGYGPDGNNFRRQNPGPRANQRPAEPGSTDSL